MTRLAVITDVHANLPALDAALAAITSLGCEAIVHTGDAVGIGPFPAETLDRMLAEPTLRFVMGNHDAWLAQDVATHPPAWMDAEEIEHHQWVSAQVDPALWAVVAGWPSSRIEEVGGRRVHFTHYARPDGLGGFAPIVHDAGPAELDALFADVEADLVFFGHHHPRADQTGRARYVNPGALGCHDVAMSRFAVLEVDDGAVEIRFHEAPYDAAPVLRALDERDVPERDLIRRAFLRFEG